MIRFYYIAFLLPYYILQGVTYEKIYKIEILPSTAPAQCDLFPTESSTHSISHSTFLAFGERSPTHAAFALVQEFDGHETAPCDMSGCHTVV